MNWRSYRTTPVSVRPCTLPGHAAPPVLRFLQGLTRSCPPRAQASVFRLVWNGWCTDRRFQHDTSCPFCRKVHSEDSIQHFPYCAVVREFAKRYLKLPALTFANWIGLDLSLHAQEDYRRRIYFLIWIIYRSRQHLVHALRPPDDTLDTIRQTMVGIPIHQPGVKQVLREIRNAPTP